MVPRRTTFLGSLPPDARGFFNMVPHLTGPHGGLIEEGITASFKGRWKDRKSKFKRHEFVLRDGYKEPIKIRDFPPTDFIINEWRKLCDHFTSEKHLACSSVVESLNNVVESFNNAVESFNNAFELFMFLFDVVQPGSGTSSDHMWSLQVHIPKPDPRL
ncbi:hypothetical protein Tco_0853505 [Tanacetum coccineum]